MEGTKINIGDEEYEKYIEELIDEGYLSRSGMPLKCFCGSNQLEEMGQYYENHYLVEYGLKCSICGKKLGTWAYGSWDTF